MKMTTPIDQHPYKVLNERGAYVLQAQNDCKYDPEIELAMLLSHHKIIDNGAELTIPEVEAKIGDQETIAEIYHRHRM